MPSARIAGLAAAAALLASAACAQADSVTTDYSVDVQIAAHYHLKATPPTYSGVIDAGFTYDIQIPKVTFKDGDLVADAQAPITMSNVDITSHQEHYTDSGTVSTDCVGDSIDPLPPALLTESHLAALNGANLRIRPFIVAPFNWTCSPGGDLKFPLLNPSTDEQDGPVDVVFVLPAQATEQGKIIQLINEDHTTANCPLYANPQETPECTLHMQGQVTFTRTGQDTQIDPVPLVTPPPPPAPQPTSDEDLLEPLTKAKLTASGATVVAGCASACTLKAQAYAGAHKVASSTLTLAAGATAQVKLHFGAAARRAVRRAHGVRVVVTATPQGGGTPVKRTLKLKLRRI